MKINISGFCFEFNSKQKTIKKLSRRYSSFLGKGRSDFVFNIEFCKRPSLPFKPKISLSKNRLIIERGDFSCELNLKTRKGLIEITPKIQSFDSFLRVLCGWLLINNDGFLLHSAGAMINNKAYLFIGKSGAGKSTISKILQRVENRKQKAKNKKRKPEIEILTDELVPVRIEKGKVKIYGSPFWGEMKNDGENLSLNLDKIFILKKSAGNSAVYASSAEVYKIILRCVMSFSKQKSDFLKVSKTINEICRKIKVFDLNFSNKDDSFLNCII